MACPSLCTFMWIACECRFMWIAFAAVTFVESSSTTYRAGSTGLAVGCRTRNKAYGEENVMTAGRHFCLALSGGAREEEEGHPSSKMNHESSGDGNESYTEVSISSYSQEEGNAGSDGDTDAAEV